MKREQIVLLEDTNLEKVFRLSGKDGQSVSVHENIAAQYSGYFQAILKNNLNFKENRERHIVLQDAEHETLKSLVAYLYSKQCPYNFKDNANNLPAFKLYVLANYLQIPWLKKCIIDNYFWNFRRHKTKPTVESTEYLLENMYHASDLCSLVVCHWRDAPRHYLRSPIGNTDFLALLRAHTFRQADGYKLKSRLNLSKILPCYFYPREVSQLWVQSKREKLLNPPPKKPPGRRPYSARPLPSR